VIHKGHSKKKAVNNLLVASEDVPVASDDVLVASEGVPVATEDVPVVTEDVPVDTEDLPVAIEDLPAVTKDVAVQTDPIVLDTKEVEMQTLEIEHHSDIPYEPVPMELADDPRSVDTEMPDNPVDTELLSSCNLPPANDDYMICESNNNKKFFPLVTKHQGILKMQKVNTNYTNPVFSIMLEST